MGGSFKKGLIIFLILIIGFGFFVIIDNYNSYVYTLSFNPLYLALIVFLIGLCFFLVLKKKDLKLIKLKPLYFVTLLPVALYPLFRCYFKIPYLFCHACPRKCVFGYIRNYGVPLILLLNLEKRSWCFGFCPFGYLQDLSFSRKKSTTKFSFIRYLFLFLIIIFFIIMMVSKANYGLFYAFFFKNIYSISIIVMVIAIIIFITSFFIHRFYCNYVCPIGTIGDILLKAQRISIKWR